MRHVPSRPHIAFLVIFFSIVLLIGIWLVFRGNGYRVLTNPLRFVRTGVISLHVDPRHDVTVELNRQRMPTGQFDYKDLIPGRYSIVVNRSGFTPWGETVDVQGGRLIRFSNIQLFYEEPKATSIIELADIETVKALFKDIERVESGIQIFGGEVWANDQFVSRYGSPVRQAVWLPGKHHLIVVLDKSIHVIEVTGGHDLQLITFENAPKTLRVIPFAGGQKLAVEADDTYTTYEITTSTPFLNFPTQ